MWGSTADCSSNGAPPRAAGQSRSGGLNIHRFAFFGIREASAGPKFVREFRPGAALPGR